MNLNFLVLVYSINVRIISKIKSQQKNYVFFLTTNVFLCFFFLFVSVCDLINMMISTTLKNYS